jgi:hypothetical protein
MSSPWASDSNRRFVVNFFPSDDTISVNEISMARNVNGSLRFLARGKVEKPRQRVDGEPDFYDIEDFYIGN